MRGDDHLDARDNFEYKTCPFCGQSTLYVYPDGRYVKCLNDKCKITGIIAQDGDARFVVKYPPKQ